MLIDYKLEIVLILTIGLALATLLGYLSQRLKLPPILGYLLAGYLIGPYSPGFVANLDISRQLAEIGVILMLFGVGLNFKLQDLINVKNIAIPGAIGQTLITALLTAFLMYALGWSLKSGIIAGFAIGVASTVVLVRVLSDFRLMNTVQGHISVGWLIVEDIITVAVLLLLPMLALFFEGSRSFMISTAMGLLFLMVVKLVLLAFIMLVWGHRIVSYILTNIVRLRSHELFTLAVLALIFLIAAGSSLVFGTSMALGAFIAGIVIGQTEVRHQASANALPLKDLFAVIFFLSIGMLFNPLAISENWSLFVLLLAIILIVKPLIAFLIMIGFQFPFKIALAVSIALAQIGEFSFILADEALNLRLFPQTGFDILVACSLVSISLNPLLFRLVNILELRLTRSRLHDHKATLLKDHSHRLTHLFELQHQGFSKVILVGFGPIGQAVTDSLRKFNFSPVIIEQNIDTVSSLKDKGLHLIYGDATLPHILEAAQIEIAKLLIITIPESAATMAIIESARHLNPRIKIVARVHYLADQSALEAMGVKTICCEKETAKAFIQALPGLIRS